MEGGRKPAERAELLVRLNSSSVELHRATDDMVEALRAARKGQDVLPLAGIEAWATACAWALLESRRLITEVGAVQRPIVRMGWTRGKQGHGK